MLHTTIISPSKGFDYSRLSPADEKELRTIAKKVGVHMRRTTYFAIQTGQELLKAKDALPFRTFSRWCIEAACLELRTAQNFMRLAELAASHDLPKVAGLPMSVAYLIAAPSAPSAIVTEVIDDANRGSCPNVREVKIRIRAARNAVVTDAEPKPPTIKNQSVEVESTNIAAMLMEALDPDQRERLAAYLAVVDQASLHQLGIILKDRTTLRTKAQPSASPNLVLPRFGRVSNKLTYTNGAKD